MQPKNRLAIFDIDDTLTDSLSVHQTAFVHALEEMGLVDFDTNWSSYKHHTDTYIFDTIFLLQFGRNTTKDDIDNFENALEKYVAITVATNPFGEIKEAGYFLDTLTHHSEFDIVFATGSLMKPAIQKIRLTKIPINGNLISAANEIRTREELVLNAIEKAKDHYGNEHYEQIISFGDGLWDYETAKKLNIDFIGIGNSKLLDHGVTNFFPDFTHPELFALLNIKTFPRQC
jgi:phosphoglycolate phosphatase-like HAD superfamily hydrolase